MKNLSDSAKGLILIGLLILIGIIIYGSYKIYDEQIGKNYDKIDDVLVYSIEDGEEIGERVSIGKLTRNKGINKPVSKIVIKFKRYENLQKINFNMIYANEIYIHTSNQSFPLTKRSNYDTPKTAISLSQKNNFSGKVEIYFFNTWTGIENNISGNPNIREFNINKLRLFF